MKERVTFGFVYLILAAVLGFWTYTGYHSSQIPLVHKTIKTPCLGIHGVERCVKSQLAAQGAPADMELTCSAAKFPGYVRYVCSANFGLGAGCAVVTATRDKDGYPIVEAGAQKPCV